MTSKSIYRIDHRDARQYKTDVSYRLNTLQAMDDHGLSLIELDGLHHTKQYRTQQEHPAGIKQHLWMDETKCKATCADNHQHTAQQENSTLYFTQLFRFLSLHHYF